MQRGRFIDVTYTHTEGMETCIVPPGMHFPGGTTLLEKRRMLEGDGPLGWLRTSLLNEPRGHVAMYGGFLTAPTGPDHDAGIIWSDGQQCNDMCGHGTIALGMAMVALGMVPESEDGRTFIRLDTTAGPVVAEVGSSRQAVEWTRFENVPAYVAALDVPIELPGYGEVKVDIAFGGNYFAIVNWSGREKRVCPENGALFRELGHLVRRPARGEGRPETPAARAHPLSVARHRPARHLLARARSQRGPVPQRARALRRPARPIPWRDGDQRDDGDAGSSRRARDRPDHPVRGTARQRHLRKAA